MNYWLDQLQQLCIMYVVKFWILSYRSELQYIAYTAITGLESS